MARISVDSKQLQELFGVNGAFALISLFNIVSCITISYVFGWKLTAVTMFAATPTLFVATWMRIKYERGVEALNNHVFAENSQFAMEAINAFRTVIALNMQGAFMTGFSTLLEQQRRTATRRASYFTLVFAFADGIPLCAMALTFLYGGQLLASREYDPRTFFVI